MKRIEDIFWVEHVPARGVVGSAPDGSELTGVIENLASVVDFKALVSEDPSQQERNAILVENKTTTARERRERRTNALADW